MPWDWSVMSRNPSVTFEHVLQHLDMPWDFNVICKKPFFLEPFEQERVAAITIQRAFKKSMSNPNYTMCQKRLMREFECLHNVSRKKTERCKSRISSYFLLLTASHVGLLQGLSCLEAPLCK